MNGQLVSCRIEIAPLFHKMISLRTISLVDVDLDLYKNREDENPNYQFIVDALKSKDKTAKSTLNLRINSIILRRLSLHYNLNYLPATPGKFNLAHLDISRINANISLRLLRPDTLNTRVRWFSLREKSGLYIAHLSFDMRANKKQSIIERLHLEMKGSEIKRQDVTVNYAWNDKKSAPEDLLFKGSLNNAQISTADIAPFVPALKGYNKTFLANASFVFHDNQLRVPTISISSRDRDFLLQGHGLSMKTKDRSYLSLTLRNLYAKASFIKQTYEQFAKKNTPGILCKLGDIHITSSCNINKAPKHISLRGNLVAKTDAGNVTVKDLHYTDGTFQGDLMTENTSLKNFLPQQQLGQIAVNAHVNGSFVNNKLSTLQFKGALPYVEWKNYEYHNLNLNADLLQNHIAAQAVINDVNANMSVKASALVDRKTGTISHLLATADITRFSPHTLGLTKTYPNTSFSGQVETNIKQLNLNNPEGYVRIRNFSMVAPDRAYKTDTLSASINSVLGTKHISIKSDFLTAQADGDFSFKALPSLLPIYFQKNFPSLFKSGLIKPSYNEKSWSRIHLSLQNADFLKKVLNLPIETEGAVTLDGEIDNRNKKSSIVFNSDKININGNLFKNARLYGRGDDDQMYVIVQGSKPIKNSELKVTAEINADKENATTELTWFENQKYNGNLQFVTNIKKFAETGNISTIFQTSHLTINDSIWNVYPSKIEYGNNKVAFHNFRVARPGQSLLVNGTLSPHAQDSLQVDLERVDLAYILNMVDFHAVDFSGMISGRANLTQTLSHPLLNYNVRVEEFHFNEAAMGTANITGNWSADEGKINIDAFIKDSISHLLVKGYVSPKEKGIDLHFYPHNTTLCFIKKYVSGIFGDIKGNVSGTLRLFGPFKKLDFEGNDKATLSVKVLSTGVNYTFQTDSVMIYPGTFAFKDVTVTDKYGNKGLASGKLMHNHIHDLSYDFQANCKQLLIFDKPKSPDMPFFATVFGTGDVKLKGHPGVFSADIDIQPNDNTLFTYLVHGPEVSDNRQMINYVHKKAENATDTIAEQKEEDDGGTTDIFLNLNIDANPHAGLRLIMDEKTDDNILVHGTGNLKASYYNKGRFSMYGTYTVDDGIYKMSLQDIIRKNFTFKRGGQIVFNGDPLNGNLDLQAVYTVNSASLSDLSPNGNFTNNTVKVDCILNFGGKASSPQVSFDLDLPTVSDDEKRMVKSLINTEEDMNMQIIYLLGIGRFYTYDYAPASTTTNQSQSAVAMKSFLSSTLSSHLNDILANAIGVKNWSFGANLSTGSVGWSDMEVEGLLNGRMLNNRLLINGNFGYRDRPNYQNNFIGDFDIRWLLTPSGSVSLKAYSETNDRYFTKSTLTTQGGGIMLKRDFSNLPELFKIKKR